MIVSLNQDSSTAEDNLCTQGSRVSLSRLACCILNLANKHDITVIPLYIPPHLNVKVDIPFMGEVGSRIAYSSWHSLSGTSNFGVNWRWICWFPHVPISVIITTVWRICYCWEP